MKVMRPTVLTRVFLIFLCLQTNSDVIPKYQVSNASVLCVTLSGFGGLEVACWPLVPKFAGSNPAEAVRFLEKILSTPSFGREVKPFVPCRIFAACKRTRKCMRGSRSFLSKLPAISRPSSSSFHY